MLLHKWIRLSKDDAKKVLDAIGDKCNHEFFSDDMTDVFFKTLPFYTNYKMFKLSNYSTMPVFSTRFLGNGNDFIKINGLANPIYEVNRKDPIHLTEQTIIQYLKFFFRYVQGSEGEVFVILAPSEIPYFDNLDKDKQAEIKQKFKEIKTATNVGADGLYYTVTAQILYGDAIIQTDINMKENGTIFFSNQDIIAERVHLAKSIYHHDDID